MNTLVLAVAGVFVLAGLVLIVLSFLVGRTKPVAESARTGVAVDASPAENAAAFIDKPLAKDMEDDLGDRKKAVPTPAVAAAASATTAPAGAAAGVTATSDVAAATAASEAAETKAADAAPAERAEERAGPAATAAAPTPAANLVGFNFRVQLGFKFLQNGLYEDGVAEFQKALALTDDRDAKLKLYVEIGNVFRTQRMSGPAAASYMQATSYTENPMLLEHLERTISDMMESDTSTQGTSGSTKEE
ncbi:MAG: hypothetical protein KKA32_10760 [Actinobacteria bacterium]|nr:hypothetical protein [Actinomycetota bacterium]